jgi:hypothetical protein
MGDDVWPDGVGGIRPVGDHPEALVGVMNNRNDLIGHRRHGPVLTQEVQV